jgi:serine/threonine protein kinase
LTAVDPPSQDYAAPELIDKQPYWGPDVDIWAAGCVLYVMLTEFIPFSSAARCMALEWRFPPDMEPSPKLQALLGSIFQTAARRASMEALLSHLWTTEDSVAKLILNQSDALDEAVVLECTHAVQTHRIGNDMATTSRILERKKSLLAPSAVQPKLQRSNSLPALPLAPSAERMPKQPTVALQQVNTTPALVVTPGCDPIDGVTMSNMMRALQRGDVGAMSEMITVANKRSWLELGLLNWVVSFTKPSTDLTEDSNAPMAWLLRNGWAQHINDVVCKTTPLCLAAKGCHIGACQLLLEHKADVNLAVEQGWTPLMLAVRASGDQW